MGASTVERSDRVIDRVIGWAAVAAVATTLATPSLAQDGPSTPAGESKASAIKLELNRLEPAGESCRTYLMVDNSKGQALRSMKVDLFAFDQEGIAQKRLAVELGPVGERKTIVRLFDFPGIACPKIGRILLNDVLACEGGEASRETCLERIETASKTQAEFFR